VIAATASLAAAVPWNPATDKTMNGQYHFGGPQVAGAPTTHRGTNYFEVTTPAYTSTYAQVNWDSFTVPLDPAVVKELDGKMVNFVGYEFDMVEDKNKDGNFTSVHAWELYNHHYGNTIMGKGTKLVKTGVPVQDHFHDGMSDESLFPGMKFVNTELKDTDRRADAGAFTAGGLIVGNGAESRKTFHYFGEGYGVMVESPYAAAIHPMMIDTKNRALNGTSQRPTGHGMVPPSSTVNPDQMYSPIHECPCTDKWVKKISSYSTLKSGTCNPEITDAPTCFAAAQELGLKPVKMNSTVSNNVLPPGCSIQATSGGYDIVFNTNAKTAGTCGEPVKSGPTGPPLKSTCNLTGTWTDLKSKAVFEFKPSGANAYTVLRMGKPTATVTVGAPTVADPQGTVSGKWGEQTIPAVMNTYSAAGSPVCSEMLWGNGADFVLSPYSNKPPVPKVLPRVAGMSEDLTNITLDMDPSKDLVTITLEGPSDVWFGAGFGYHHVSTGGADPSVGVSMVGTNWTIVVLGNGTITERKLGNHEPGYQLPDTLNVVSNTVVDGRRTVVVTRSIEGKASDVYKFDPTANQVTYINAIGGGPDFEFHQAKASGVVYMVELDYPTCICNFAGDQGSIGGTRGAPSAASTARSARCLTTRCGSPARTKMWSMARVLTPPATSTRTAAASGAARVAPSSSTRTRRTRSLTTTFGSGTSGTGTTTRLLTPQPPTHHKILL